MAWEVGAALLSPYASTVVSYCGGVVGLCCGADTTGHVNARWYHSTDVLQRISAIMGTSTNAGQRHVHCMCTVCC